MSNSVFTSPNLCYNIPRMTVDTTVSGNSATEIQSTLVSATTEAAHHVDYTDGALIWKSDNDADVPVAEVKASEIVFILEAPTSYRRGYLIFSLSENDTAVAPQDTDTKSGPFKLSALLSSQELPHEILKTHLLDLDNHGGAHAWPRDGPLLDVIISTGSGTGKSKVFYDSVLKPLLGAVGLFEKGHQDGGSEESHGYGVITTTSPRTITLYASQVQNENGPRTIILLSGDGGVIDLLNGLDTGAAERKPEERSSQPTVAILPLGTGNALFHSLHKPLYQSSTSQSDPSNLVLGLRTLFTGVAKSLPTFKASFSPRSKLISAPALEKVAGTTVSTGNGDDKPVVFIDHLIGGIVASYGFHASLVWESDTPAYRVHGDKRFGMAAAELLKVSHGYEAVVEVRKGGSAELAKVPRTRFNYVLATLVSNLEKTFTISPASKPLDGRLRLVHFGDVGGERTMDIMMAAYRGGEHVGMRWKSGGDGEEGQDDGVGYEEVDEVKVTILEEDPRWRKVCIDGTIVEIEKGGWMSVAREPEGQERVKVVVNREVVSETESESNE